MEYVCKYILVERFRAYLVQVLRNVPENGPGFLGMLVAQGGNTS